MKNVGDAALESELHKFVVHLYCFELRIILN